MRFAFVLPLALALATPALASGGGEAAPKADHKVERKLTSSPSWVPVDPIAVGIVRQNAIEGLFLVEFGLDVPDDALRARISETLPRLRDIWLRALSDFALTRVRVRRQADVVALAERLQGTTDRALGAIGARVLLLQAMVREK